MRRSKRTIERRLNELEDERTTTDGIEYGQTRSEARERYDRDEYDDGSLRQVWDAYALAYENEDDYIEAIGATIHYFSSMRKISFNRALSTETTVPPVPTEQVTKAIEAYSEAHGIAAYGLRTRHPDSWVARLIETLYFQQMRVRAIDSPIVWTPADVVDDICQWRTAITDDQSHPDI